MTVLVLPQEIADDFVEAPNLDAIKMPAGLTGYGRSLFYRRLRRHIRNCSICLLRDLDLNWMTFNDDYVSWTPFKELREKYGFETNSTIVRHAEAWGLDAKRDYNVRGMYHKMIKCGFENIRPSKINPTHILDAITNLGRMDGLFKDNLNIGINLNDRVTAIMRMTPAEIEAKRASIIELVKKPTLECAEAVFGPEETHADQTEGNREPDPDSL